MTGKARGKEEEGEERCSKYTSRVPVEGNHQCGRFL